jgi:hypothetical protein
VRSSRTVGGVAFGDVNIVLPALVIVAGAAVAIAGKGYLGVGIGVGALLAYFNSWLLASRIEVATSTGVAAAAMISMQLGLLVTFTVVGGLTILMVFISLPMTVAMAISFFLTQTAELGLYYRARRSRRGPSGLKEGSL